MRATRSLFVNFVTALYINHAMEVNFWVGFLKAIGIVKDALN